MKAYFKSIGIPVVSAAIRTFPLPDHVDQNKMEMTTAKEKIVLKFPKVKT